VEETRKVVMGYDAGRRAADDVARVPHADRCVADAICWIACQSGRAPAPKLKIVPGTLAYTLERLRAEREANERW
jgi:hypothetical protein